VRVDRNGALVHQTVFLTEFIYSARCIENFLFAGVKRMANRANLDLKLVFGERRFCLELVSATALYGNFMVCGMDIGFHRFGFFRNDALDRKVGMGRRFQMLTLPYFR